MEKTQLGMIVIVIILVITGILFAIFALPMNIKYGDKGMYQYNLLNRHGFKISGDLDKEEAHRVLDELLKFRDERNKKGCGE